MTAIVEPHRVRCLRCHRPAVTCLCGDLPLCDNHTGIVILLDPIFQGLAVALISGVVVSTALTLVLLPLLVWLSVDTVGVGAVVGLPSPEPRSGPSTKRCA